MLRFELVDDETIEYWKVILDDRSIIGIISSYGLRLSPRQDNSMTLNSADLKILAKKVFEAEKLGIFICSKCGGSPMFPNKVKNTVNASRECDWSIHQYSRLPV